MVYTKTIINYHDMIHPIGVLTIITDKYCKNKSYSDIYFYAISKEIDRHIDILKL